MGKMNLIQFKNLALKRKHSIFLLTLVQLLPESNNQLTNLIITADKLWSTIEIYTWSTIFFNLHQWFARQASLDLQKFVNDTFLFAKVSNKNT